ncbi:MAG: hypothetical protein HYU78_02925 [Rhodocyclales bacterium]|nr:hypothetical protein [Rhodocyclales bacterium]
MTTKHGMMSVADAAALIGSGRHLCIAGDESALRQLPAGNWIGGTIPYFMGEGGGLASREAVHVTVVGDHGEHADAPRLRLCDADALPQLCRNAPEHGYSILILPAFSDCHLAFAREAPNYEEMYLKPLVGWVAGVHLDDLGTAAPQVVLGSSGEFSATQAVVMDVPLPPEKFARVDIVNPFRPGDGARIVFADTGFAAGDCRIDGQPGNLAEHLAASGADGRLPLVADYCGAPVNVSIKGIDRAAGRVDFYAPVFPGLEYRLAAPVADPLAAIRAALPPPGTAISFACNCILNFLYLELEGQRTGEVGGPMSFGEIGYQLLNQTLVYLTVEG